LYCPSTLEDEEEEEAPFSHDDEVISIYDFIEFLLDERHEGNLIIDAQSYKDWKHQFAYRLNAIALPSNPEFSYKWSWSELSECTEKAADYEIRKLKKPILLAVDEVLAEKEAVYCKWLEFVETVALQQIGDPTLNLTGDFSYYEKWYQDNLAYALRLDLPKRPDVAYQKTWEVVQNRLQQMIYDINNEVTINFDDNND